MADYRFETGTDDLIATKKDGVAVLTMNRPERRNALSTDMLKALGSVLEACEADAEVGAVVLTGAAGAFCAGGDVKGMNERNTGGTPADIDTRIHLFAVGLMKRFSAA